LETTRRYPNRHIVGRLAGGAGLAGGVRATENLGWVGLDGVGGLPQIDGYGDWAFRRGGVDRVTLFDGAISGIRSELGGEASPAHILRGRRRCRRFNCNSLKLRYHSLEAWTLQVLRELPTPVVGARLFGPLASLTPGTGFGAVGDVEARYLGQTRGRRRR
jgi:hypothetical protein